MSFTHCLLGIISVQLFASLLGSYKTAVVTNSFECTSIIVPLIVTIINDSNISIEERGVIILFVCSLVSLISGLVLYLLGALKIASIVQNIPLPVRSGVFASIGYFCYTSYYEIQYGESFSFSLIFHNQIWHLILPHV